MGQSTNMSWIVKRWKITSSYIHSLFYFHYLVFLFISCFVCSFLSFSLPPSSSASPSHSPLHHHHHHHHHYHLHYQFCSSTGWKPASLCHGTMSSICVRVSRSLCVSVLVCVNFHFKHLFLTHYHTMTPFDAPGKQAFWNHCGKRRNYS